MIATAFVSGLLIGAIVMNRVIHSLLVSIQNHDQRVAIRALKRLAQLELGLAFLKSVSLHAKRVAGDLLDNCVVMHSRVAALLQCDDALDALCAEDVFGEHYAELLSADELALRTAITNAGRDVEEVSQ